MSTPLTELRQYLTSTRKMPDEGVDPFSVSLAVDSRLVEVANHVAICHRVTAESRAELRFSFFPARAKLNAKIHSAGEILEEMEVLQQELIDVKGECLSRIRSEIRRLWKVVKSQQEQA
ncbi:hypothetical protein [Stenotrophomonas maltophilia]|uniref:Uncharacterized protein n=1 Tax=Stenotrophomonas maltophilia TaxID=40324 RepID=A0AAJ2MZI6_STEMA|nr:hypothetical protein [Stenotrophomonas maltophilia]MDT3468644.1 hypothetical protein [Stenotrophomonas maltophilia]